MKNTPENHPSHEVGSNLDVIADDIRLQHASLQARIDDLRSKQTTADPGTSATSDPLDNRSDPLYEAIEPHVQVPIRRRRAASCCA